MATAEGGGNGPAADGGGQAASRDGADRKELQRRQQAERTRVVDTPERVGARVTRLAQAGQLQPEALVKAIALSKPAGAVKQGSLLTWKRCR